MARKLVGYGLSGHFNGTTFIEDKSSLEHCPNCGTRYDLFTHNPNYKMGRKRRGHLFYTYDLIPIVTQPFKDFVWENGYAGVSFLPFKRDLERFHLIVENVIPYDWNVPELKLDEYCNICKRYNSVATGTDDRFVAVNAPLDDGFYRTDLFFGHGNNKGPIYVVGLETVEKMKAFGLKGIIFTPTFGLGDNGRETDEKPKIFYL